jgi:NADH dehydrogenase
VASTEQDKHHIVIVGGGFAGLYAAKAPARSPVAITLIDRRNFHLFQPLLYQVATGNVAPGDVASSLRGVLSRHKNVRVLLAELMDVLPDEHKVILSDRELVYDTLIVATGVQPRYFGHDDWSRSATGLKTVEDALEMRRQHRAISPSRSRRRRSCGRQASEQRPARAFSLTAQVPTWIGWER